MQSENIQHLTQLGIYKKAIEIFTLSRRVVAYITDEKDVLELRRSTKKVDIFANNILTHALGLIPRIVETEHQKDRYLKLKLAQSLESFISEINRDCIHLLCIKTSGKDYLKLLKSELRKLQLLHRGYVTSIIEA